MSDVIIPPEMWKPDAEGVLVAWSYPDGAEVQEGDVIAEVMLDKAQMELCASASGRLWHRMAEEAVVRGGDVIGVIE